MTRSSVIYQLYMTSRAYAFWALEDFLVYNLLQRDFAAEINYAVLDAARGTILDAYQSALGRTGRATTHLPESGSEGLVVTLTEKEYPHAFEL